MQRSLSESRRTSIPIDRTHELELPETNLAGLTVASRSIGSGMVIYGRSAKPDLAYGPIRSLDDAQIIMKRKHALGGTIVKSYKQPTRAQRRTRAGRS